MTIAAEGLDGYEITGKIGRGGFATVYQATDLNHDRTVAIKILDGQLDPNERRRFDRERRAVGKLASHPNVVPVFESGYSVDGEAYMVLEFEPGGSLGDRLRTQGPIAWREAIDLVVGVCSAVEAAHAVGIRHRDIKPDNILLSEYGVPKLADFGIASVSTGATTAAGTSLTLSHSPPEMLEGLDPTDAMDIYAMASTLHNLIAGTAPFFKDGNDTIPALMRRILHDDPPLLTGNDMPPVLADTIRFGLSKEPVGRPRSISEFRRQLLAAAGEITSAPFEGAAAAGEAADLDQSRIATEPLAISGGIPAGHAAVSLDPDKTAAVDRSLHRTDQLSQRRGDEDSADWSSGRIVGLVLVCVAVVGLVVVGWRILRSDDDGSDGRVAATPTTDAAPTTAPTTLAPTTLAPTSATLPGGYVVAETAAVGRSSSIHDLVAGTQWIWSTGRADGSLTALDPKTGGTVFEVDLGEIGRPAAVIDGRVWVPTGEFDEPGVLVVFDEVSGDELGRVSVGLAPSTPVEAAGLVWVANTFDQSVSVIDPIALTVVATLPLSLFPTGEPVLADGLLWFPTAARDRISTVVAIDPLSQSVVATIEVGPGPDTPLLANGLLWFANINGASEENSTVSVIDPSSQQLVATIPVGPGPTLPAFVGGQIWVPNTAVGSFDKGGTISVVDPVTFAVTKTLEVNESPLTPVVVDDVVFVAHQGCCTAGVAGLFLFDTEAQLLATLDLSSELKDAYQYSIPVVLDGRVFVASTAGVSILTTSS